jgi:hypothetical protein
MQHRIPAWQRLLFVALIFAWAIACAGCKMQDCGRGVHNFSGPVVMTWKCDSCGTNFETRICKSEDCAGRSTYPNHELRHRNEKDIRKY